MKLKINGIPVEIERSASRTWKKSTTPEDKKSLNWKEFIDTATSKLTLRVYPKDKDMVVKLNDEAQMMIDQWFGNTIETIFILNQFKILQLLSNYTYNKSKYTKKFRFFTKYFAKTSVLCRYLGFNRIYSFEETLV